MLREKNFDINEVETAIIEANGSLSVLKKPEKNSVTREDMNMKTSKSSMAFPVIIEGTIYSEILREVNVNEPWLIQQLSDQGVNDISDVFFASINRDLELHVSLKNELNTPPPIKH